MEAEQIVSIHEQHGDLIATLRSGGSTLQQIGDRLGVTRERVRQVLSEHFLDCSPPRSTKGAARTLGMSYHRFRSATKRLGIQPMGRSRGRVWWSQDVLRVIQTAQELVCCRICGGPLLSSRQVYCSEGCLNEGRSLNQRIRKYRERVGIAIAPRKEG